MSENVSRPHTLGCRIFIAKVVCIFVFSGFSGVEDGVGHSVVNFPGVEDSVGHSVVNFPGVEVGVGHSVVDSTNMSSVKR